MSAPYRRYAPLERLEDTSGPYDAGFDCNGCPDDGCCGDCVTRHGCTCRPPADLDPEDLIIEEALEARREDRAA